MKELLTVWACPTDKPSAQAMSDGHRAYILRASLRHRHDIRRTAYFERREVR